jgi:TPR repeat protein
MNLRPLADFLGHFLDHDAPESNSAWGDKIEAALAELATGNHFQALHLLKPIATTGDAFAQTLVGAIYREMKSLPEHYQESIKWFALAAAQEYPLGELNLGIMYLHGLGVDQNCELALQYLTKAATSGNVTAQFDLANIFEQGDLGQSDYAQAAYWYGLAAKNDYAPALNALANLLARGFGVPQNVAHALSLWERAAKADNVEALLSMADFCLERADLVTDHKIALRCLERAAKLGSGIAQSRLGHMYLLGKGVQQNERKAANLLYEAAENGDEDAVITLKGLAEEEELKRNTLPDYSKTPHEPPSF